MREYVKINTLFKRDLSNHGKIIEGEWACPEFGYLRHNEWQFTEKVGGTNVRVSVENVISHGLRLVFGGRRRRAQMPVTLLQALTNLFSFDKFSSTFPDDMDLTKVTLYGEGYGAKIQKGGGNYRPDQSFVLFDVLVGDWWLQRSDVEDVAAKMGLDVVPIVGSGSLLDAIEIVRSGKEESKWGPFTPEGLVLRPLVELKTRSGHRVIAKIKHRDFTGGK